MNANLGCYHQWLNNEVLARQIVKHGSVRKQNLHLSNSCMRLDRYRHHARRLHQHSLFKDVVHHKRFPRAEIVNHFKIKPICCSFAKVNGVGQCRCETF